jgi:AhpD family alkylhydroperoxidase
MAYIALPDGLPGIRALLAYRPDAARPLNDLVDVLLRGPHTLTPGERELIATYVSARNDCSYCRSIHGAIAARQLGDADELVEQVVCDLESAAVSPKL